MRGCALESQPAQAFPIFVGRHIFGEVERVSCETQRRSPLNIGEDTATMMLRHTSGAVSVVECTYESRELPDPFPQTLLVIEGAGGVMSPIAEDATNLDLFAELGLEVILVTGSYLGAVSHTLTAIAALQVRGVAVAAIVVSESMGDAPPITVHARTDTPESSSGKATLSRSVRHGNRLSCWVT